MKKYCMITAIVLLLIPIYALTSIPEFEALSPQEKVNTIIREYNSYNWFAYPLDFTIKGEIIAEEKEKTLPYMIYLLKKYEAHPYDSEHHEVEILDHIIDFRLFQTNELCSSELKELEPVYTALIDKYLKRYKKIDAIAVVLEKNLVKFSTQKWPKANLRWVRKMYRKYVKLGYEGLTIDYEELKRVSGID